MEEVVVTLVVVSAVIMMTVRVAMIATGTGIVTEIEIVMENGIVTGTVKTGTTGVKRGVRFHCINPMLCQYS